MMLYGVLFERKFGGVFNRRACAELGIGKAQTCNSFGLKDPCLSWMPGSMKNRIPPLM